MILIPTTQAEKRIKEFHGQELSHACSRVIFVYICKVMSKFCEIVTLIRWHKYLWWKTMNDKKICSTGRVVKTICRVIFLSSIFLNYIYEIEIIELYFHFMWKVFCNKLSPMYNDNVGRKLIRYKKCGKPQLSTKNKTAKVSKKNNVL